MADKEMTRRGGNHDRADGSPGKRDAQMISDYEHGALIGGVALMSAFGGMMLWAAWWW